MKILYFLAFICVLLTDSPSGYAQRPAGPIRLKNGNFSATSNMLDKRLSKTSLNTSRFNRHFYLVLQFDTLPGVKERKALADQGIFLSDYLPGNAFQAEIRDDVPLENLKKFPITGIYKLSKEFKISKKLQQSIKKNTFYSTPEKPVAVSFFGSVSRQEAISRLEALGARLVPSKIMVPNTVLITADAPVLQKIADLPFVSYISEQAIKDIPLNYNNRGIHSLDALSAPSGRNLQGQGITMGIGDDANPSTHIDFTNRLIVRTPAPTNFHGTYTTGIAAGAGLLNPLYKGMAPKVRLVNKFFSDVIADAPTYITDHQMVITNNSYYSGEAGCVGNGDYNFLSYYTDHQLNSFPFLLHVFASGNDGSLNCSPYAHPYATIKSGFQCAKNVLTVGNMDNVSYGINTTSSAGPVSDGRLKPEIVAGGTNVSSTNANNTYATASGTSASTPVVTGTLALLYERYRQLHSGADPSGALIKAIACNSADDLGNPGPDFLFGFGMLNARNAIEMLENGNYITGTISQGNTIDHTLSIPAGAQQVKIMLYWSDPEASFSAGAILVNNLDLKVTTPAPGSVIHHPLILDPDPADVTANAVEGIDNLNNIEQVVLNTPSAGDHTITIDGTNIPSGPQNYIITYQIIMPSVTVEYPFGNETLLPSLVGTPRTENIRWSAHGGDGNTFTIEYSDNNGSTWSTLSSTVPSSSRSYAWTMPLTATNQGLVRVTRNVTGYNDQSDYNFTILNQPVLTATNPCQGYAALSWPAITSATSYEIMMLKGDSMQVIGSTSLTNYLLGGLNKDSSYWLTVRAVNGSTPGRRAVAKNILPIGGTCTLSAFDNDLSVDSILSPVTGRMFTASQLGAVTEIKVRLRNLGNNATSGPFDIQYQVNGGSIQTASITPDLAAHSSEDYTFTATHNFSVAGTYTIKAWVTYTGDPDNRNDTATKVVKQLQNTAISLSPTYTEGFESAASLTYTGKVMGFEGLDRCDFVVSNSNGRVSTFVNSGFARTGNRCITLDQIYNNVTSTADSVITTFNLSGYTGTDQIWLDFFYKNHGINFNLPGNKVWIRGSETDAWIPVLTLPFTNASVGGYYAAPHINVTGLLAAAIPLQTVSSSFQIRFGEEGYKSASAINPVGPNVDNGFSYDDISLTLALNDIGITAISSPSFTGICDLSSAETVSVEVKNYTSSVITNVPVKYKVDGITVMETVASIPANTTITHTFVAKANLSAYKEYTLQAWSESPGDTYLGNDTSAVTFHTTPVITTFPYIEGFESSDGHWYSGGINSSWQWGTPIKTIINQAASGTKAWVTSLAGNYNDNELSYLYSPCFNLSTLTHPALSFSHIFKTEDACNCDKHWAEYSTDDITWNRLGAVGSGSNWYDYNMPPPVWKMSRTSWHTSSIEIPVNPAKVRFRIVMSSDGVDNYEGVGIDNIRLVDSSFTPLPLTLLSFTVSKTTTGAQLVWNTTQEFNTSKFIVQKSIDGNNYFDIGIIKAAGNSAGTINYQFADNNISDGTSFYRLKMLDIDGSYAYSPIRTVTYTGDGLTVTVYPNPITKGSLTINSSDDCNKIELRDISGRIIKEIIVHGKKHSLSVNDITKGTYFISVITTKGKTILKVVVE